MTADMNLRDAVTLHQMVVASEGRTAATQRQYLYFELVFLLYLGGTTFQTVDSPESIAPLVTPPTMRPTLATSTTLVSRPSSLKNPCARAANTGA